MFEQLCSEDFHSQKQENTEAKVNILCFYECEKRGGTTAPIF